MLKEVYEQIKKDVYSPTFVRNMLEIALTLVVFIACALMAASLEDPNTEIEPEPMVISPVQVSPTNRDIVYQVAGMIDNNTFMTDDRYMAIATWNALNSRGLDAKLIFGNPMSEDEPITQCNRLWVVCEGLAIDSAMVREDARYLEGYEFVSPDAYYQAMDALDDLQEAEVEYVASVGLYNVQFSTIARYDMEAKERKYLAENDRLVNLI